ncbi:DUF4369 domain-containing protein [Draconibacterium sp. IB214405]|uniref:DUF4369 domain-containing protein n=1 Tax=Draconibacterium sp. IB214405 TaxID=3097352 RepID=UPI002A136C07|nr:DUF4369 domain-containing protein [Draconibacterium sp. IB214405]MDX8338433.1 DUF4369 domain-containing protein [Draconibacterium sp. IB214405]
MKGLKYTFSSVFFFVILIFNASAQSHDITIQISNQPDNKIILGTIKGDEFTPIDSAEAINGTVKFQLSSSNPIGVYRLVLGKTAYAKVMDKDPQQLDFIYNNEDVILQTDFKNPVAGLKVIQSVENKIWYDFNEKENILKDELQLMEKEVDYFWAKKDTSNATLKANEFNQLQMDREQFISQTVNSFAGRYAAKMIKMYSEPFRDAYLSAEQRDEDYKANYFNGLGFTDESLIHSSAYSDRIFNYLVLCNDKGFTQDQREAEYEKAIDIIVANTNQNEEVHKFILDYMVDGFEILKMDKLIAYIEDKY